MDVSKSNQSSKKNMDTSTRPPLISAEKNIKNNGATRRSDVSSRVRVRSPSPSSISRPRRSPSPSPATNTLSSLPKRALSAERKRPSSPSPARARAPSPAKSTPLRDAFLDTRSAPRKVAGAGDPARDTSADTKVAAGDEAPAPAMSTLVLDTSADTKAAARKVAVAGAPGTAPAPAPAKSTPVRDTCVDTEVGPRNAAGARLPDAVWPSTVRSLHASFQSDKLSLPNKKPVGLSISNVVHTPDEKALPVSRKPTPERKRVSDHVENSKPVDGLHARLSEQMRWPSSTSVKVSSSALTESMDNAIDKTVRASNALLIGMGVSSLKRMSFPASRVLKTPERYSVSVGSFDGSEGGEELEQRSVDHNSLRIPNIGSSLSPDSPDKKSLSPSSVSSDSSSRSIALNPGSVRGISPSQTRASNLASIRGISPSQTRALNNASSRGVTKRVVIDQLKNSRPSEGLYARLLDQHRWPSSTNLKVSSNALTKSTDAIDRTARASRRMSFSGFGSISLREPESDSVSVGSFNGSEGQEFEGSSIDYDSRQIPKIGASSSCPTSPNKASSPSTVSSVSPSRTRASNPDQLEKSKPVEGLHTCGLDQHLSSSNVEVKVSTTTSTQIIDAIEKRTRVSNALRSGMEVPSPRKMSFPDFGSKPLEKSVGDSASVVSFNGSEGEDSVGCSVDDISLRIPKIGSSSSCPDSPDKTSLSPSSVCSLSPSRTKAYNPASFRGINPSLTRTSNADASIGVRKSGVSDKMENSRPFEGLHSRLSEPHRWPSSTVLKVSSTSLTKSTDTIDSAEKASNILHQGIGPGTMSFPDFGSKPSQKPASDSESLVSIEGEEFEVRSFDDNSLQIPNIVSSSLCPVSPDKASSSSSSSPSSISNVSPSQSRSVDTASIGEVGPFQTRASNPASVKGISSSQFRVSNPASTRGLTPSRIRASNCASSRGASPTPTRASNAPSARGVSPIPVSVSNVASTRGVSPTPRRATRGVSPTPARVSNVASTRGVSPTPSRATRGVSPTPTKATRGVSPTPTRATRGVSPTPTRATRGVSPTPTRASRGISPTPTRVSNAASTRGVSPTPARASNVVPTRGVSPTPSMTSSTSSPRGVSLTPRALIHISTRGVSPSRMRALNPPTRGVSPTPIRPSSPSRESSSSTSILSFITDIRKGNKEASHIEDVHQLRLLDNIYLQWRYANARADKLLYKQKAAAERKLYNVWRTNSELSDSVTEKRIDLEELSLKLKLYSVLRKQMAYLKEWTLVESNHTSVLSQAIEDIKKNTLNLPVTGGARADTESVKAAVCSTIDVMQRIGSSICSILSRVEGVNSLVHELAGVVAEERALLDECDALFCTTAAMQVEEYSLRTHLVQLK